MLFVYAKYIKIMSNENKTIHDFELNLICDFFSNMERQGPGSPEVTLKALSFIDNLTEKSLIADIGCGTGGQTMVLAGHVTGQVTGLDFLSGFIDIFNRNARQSGLQNRVTGIVGSMDDLPFRNEELDLIWSEGAIYNIGFERGLNEWRKYLKKGGYLAVSECSWFTDERPAEINDFWMDAYPEIDTIPNQVAKIHKAGYLPVATFILPENCWTDHYFTPKVAAQKIFLTKYAGNKIAEEFSMLQSIEEELYHKYKEYYGYLAVSECSWFTDERPAEINDFWMDAYPEIDTIPNQVAKIHKAGYLPVATFILPENCWTDHYFTPKVAAQKIFLTKYAGNKIAEEFSMLQSIEEELYHKYKEYYGYTFFIAKKIRL